MEYRYSCVDTEDIEELEFIIDNNEEIELHHFIELIGIENFNSLTTQFGYNEDFQIEEDWHITYHTGNLKNGCRFAFLQHSCIEYVFY